LAACLALGSWHQPASASDVALRYRATVCELTGDKPRKPGSFVTVVGRLDRNESGFILLDRACPGALLRLRESAPGILGETCVPEAPLVGLRCLLNSAKRPVTGRVSGVFGRSPDGLPYIEVWDLNDVTYE